MGGWRSWRGRRGIVILRVEVLGWVAVIELGMGNGEFGMGWLGICM